MSEGKFILDTMVDTIPSTAPKFYQAIGHAITQWQWVELATSEVFARVSTCRDVNVASAIFYAVTDFSDKLSLVDFAANQTLKRTDILTSAWVPLRKRLIAESEVRNALAHFMVVFEMGPAGASEKKIRMMLAPNDNPNQEFRDKRGKGRKWTKLPMSVDAINTARRRFDRLSQDLREFSQKIPEPPAPQK